MDTVWIINSDDSTATANPEVADGDYLLRWSEDELEVGRVSEAAGARAVEWLERISADTLPEGALDGLDREVAIYRAPEQAALLTAARGVEAALRERGG